MTYARTYTRVLDSNGNVVLENAPRTINSFSPNTAANICNMLENACTPGGTGSSANFSGMSVAGKTGTTGDNKDRYFVGFTPYYVAACWTGYDYPETMYFSGNPAVTLWKNVMQPIHANLEYRSFPSPTVGKPTQIFGNLNDELEAQEEAKKPKPEETEPPAETEPPTETEPPVVTEPPEETEPPVVTLPDDDPEAPTVAAPLGEE